MVQTIAPLLKSQEAPFRYYGHYYRYLIAKKEQDTVQMQEHLACLEKLKAQVPKLVIEDCRVD